MLYGVDLPCLMTNTWRAAAIRADDFEWPLASASSTMRALRACGRAKAGPMRQPHWQQSTVNELCTEMLKTSRWTAAHCGQEAVLDGCYCQIDEMAKVYKELSLLRTSNKRRSSTSLAPSCKQRNHAHQQIQPSLPLSGTDHSVPPTFKSL